MIRAMPERKRFFSFDVFPKAVLSKLDMSGPPISGQIQVNQFFQAHMSSVLQIGQKSCSRRFCNDFAF